MKTILSFSNFEVAKQMLLKFGNEIKTTVEFLTLFCHVFFWGEITFT